MKHLTLSTPVIYNIFSTLAKFCSIFLLVTYIGCTDDDSTYPQDDQPSEDNMVTLEEMSANIESIQKFVDPLFASSTTIDSLTVHIPEIKALEYVTDVFVDDGILFVTLKGNLSIGYSFKTPTLASKPKDRFIQTKASKPLDMSTSSKSEIFTRATDLGDHKHIKDINIGLIDITELDHVAVQLQELTDSVSKANMTYTPFTGNMTLKSCNVVWLLTHGTYRQKGENESKRHWLLDGYLSDSTQRAIDEDQRSRLAYWSSVTNTNIPKAKLWSNILYTKNKTPGKPIERSVSENYIKEIMTLQKDAIIFCGACESLKENDNLAKVFLDKGAIAFLGYTEAQSVGGMAGKYFIVNLLKGMTIEQAYNNIPDSLKLDRALYKINLKDSTQYKGHQIYKIDSNYYVQYNAQLLLRTRTSEGKDYCIVHPTIKTNPCSIIGETHAKIEGLIEGWNGNKLLMGTAGFCWSKGKTIPTIQNNHNKIVINDYDAQSFPIYLDINKLEPNTEYSYRAYLKLNEKIWYGDVITFKTKDPEAYFRECLIKLYKDTDGDNWIRNKNWCSDKPLQEWVGVSKKGNGLYSLSLSNNNLKGTIDLRGCSALADLFCAENQLTSIDVSGCFALTHLHCEKNQLTSLDATGCSALSHLYCEKNQLTNLDLSSCLDLWCLSCNSNQLSHLNVFGLDNLVHLNCSHNNLTSIDISGCSALDGFNCSHNMITAEITKRLFEMSFAYDRRYDYSKEIYYNVDLHEWCYYSWTDKGFGWYFPDEPSERGHKPPKNWQ